jgi:hypothetical protein
MAAVRLRGVQALVTPPWALDVGYVGGGLTAETWREARRAMRQAGARWGVVDFAPGVQGVAESVVGVPGCICRERHTRWADLRAGVPATRRKQMRRAERAGLRVEGRSGTAEVGPEAVEEMVDLHQAARERKGIPSDREALRRLLAGCAQDGQCRFFFVRDAEGRALAGGVMLGRKGRDAEPGEVLYAFGGAHRGPQSGLATVLMLGSAMEWAAAEGYARWDFGGSQDPGVDRFYEEFGGVRQPKHRVVLWQPGWGWVLRLLRPDLFR